jgi:hypothetical protein
VRDVRPVIVPPGTRDRIDQFASRLPWTIAVLACADAGHPGPLFACGDEHCRARVKAIDDAARERTNR